MDSRRAFVREFLAPYHALCDSDKIINEPLATKPRMKLRFLDRGGHACSLSRVEAIEITGRNRVLQAQLWRSDIEVLFFRPVISRMPAAQIRVLKAYKDPQAISTLRLLFDGWIK